MTHRPDAKPGPPDDGEARASAAWTVGVGLMALAIALFALPHSVQAGDAGEFSTVLLAGGVPHPSGYPWMRLFGLPARWAAAVGVPPATAAALPSACLAALAFGWGFRTTARLTGPGPAAFAMLAVASSGLLLGHAYDAEVWGPLLAFTALYLGLWLSPQAPHPFMLGLALGLGTAHHLTFVLLTPMAVGAAWPRPTSKLPALLRSGAWGLLGSACGLAFFATLLIGDTDPAAPGWRWGDMSTLDGWFHHVVRGDYGTTELSHHDADISAWAQWQRSLGSVGGAIAGPLAEGRALVSAALLLGALWLAWRGSLSRLNPPRRWGLVGTLALTTLVFPALFDLDPRSPFAAWILERFDLLPAFLWAFVVALALEAGRERVRLRPALGVTLAATWLAWNLVQGAGRRPSADAEVGAYAEAMLRSAQPEAGVSYVLGTDDHRTFPVLFTQEVLGLAPRVVYIDPALMRYAWYRERMGRRHPELPMVPQPARLARALQALPGAPPVYLANIMSRKSAELPVIPEGLLLRVLSPDELSSPRPQRWARAHLAALDRAGVDLEAKAGLPYAELAPWAGDLWGQVLERHAALVAQLQSLDPKAAAEVAARGP